MVRGWLVFLSIGCSMAGAPADGGADAMGPPFCPRSGTLFCADFDGADPMAGWTGVSMHGAATGSFDAMSTSPPRSLFATVPGSAAVPSAFAPIWETMSPLADADLELAVRADTLPAVLTIALVSYGADAYLAGLQMAMGNLYVVEDHAGVSNDLIVGPISRGQWHRLELVISTTRRRLEAKVDSTVFASFVMAAAATFTLTGKKIVSVGIVESTAISPATSVWIDDVTLR